ncbi:hypothetical protein [Clostridium beijerinckii]|uniref:hypothetical protein n=1 Tax=Clostridium beijerinckii TaxID=1520 RepID=UPI00156EF5B7|nr:hypothetical protein [Clostridium beijerinckii]NRT73689.1 hypothetical protein [Clostridium beijerinckii]
MRNSINIRFANIEDEEKIINFIKNNWNKEHIFVKEPKIFEYQHLNDEELYYVIAIDENKEIVGVCGYIPYNNENQDICQALWKVVKNSNNSIGVQMLQFLKEKSKCRVLFCNGINDKIIPIHKFLGNYVGQLKHYYRISDKDNYNIAIINDKKILEISEREFELKIIESFEQLIDIFNIKKYRNRRPYKDEKYINHRYFKHPIYKYIVLGINKNKKEIDSIIIGREIKQNNAIVFRIVDFIGLDKDLIGISFAIEKLIDDNNYEYIDFYNYGISNEIMNKAGFILKSNNDRNIIPNYFEPFEQKNIDINFFASDIKNFYLFKADGDQDRPNLIESL